MSEVIEIELDRVEECRYKPPQYFQKDRVEDLKKMLRVDGIQNHPPARFIRDGEVMDSVSQFDVQEDRSITAELIGHHEKYWARLANTDRPSQTVIGLEPVQTTNELNVVHRFLETESLKSIDLAYIVGKVIPEDLGLSLKEASEGLPFGYSYLRKFRCIHEVPDEARRKLRSFNPSTGSVYQFSRIFHHYPDALNSGCPEDAEYHPSNILSATLHGESRDRVRQLVNRYMKWADQSEAGLEYELYEDDFTEKQRVACESVAFQLQSHLKTLPPYLLRAMAHSHAHYSGDEANRRDALSPREVASQDATKEDLSWTVALSIVESHVFRKTDLEAALTEIKRWAENDGLDIIVPDVDS